MPGGRIVVAGAGSIGCFVGGMLAAAGRDVALLTRPRIRHEIARAGLRVTSFDGFDSTIADVAMSDDPELLRGAAVILVAVKSADTEGIAALIARHAADNAVVVSLQNGVGNAAVLRARLPGRRVLAAMVPFNVVAMGEGRFHRATSGDIVVERDDHDTAAGLSVPGLSLRASDDIAGVQWGKLLVNLNNALNALSGLPLSEQLARRDWRKLFADQIAEGLATLDAAGIESVPATPLSPRLSLMVLRLPDWLFRQVFGRTMKIDPHARSSMWEDLSRGRMTEIDYLQGVIVALARQHGIDVPLSRRIVKLVKEAEAARRGSPNLTPAQVRGGP